MTDTITSYACLMWSLRFCKSVWWIRINGVSSWRKNRCLVYTGHHVSPLPTKMSKARVIGPGMCIEMSTKVESPVHRCFRVFNYGRDSIPTIKVFARWMDTPWTCSCLFHCKRRLNVHIDANCWFSESLHKYINCGVTKYWILKSKHIYKMAFL